MNNKTVLITGIQGFIGKYLATALSDSFPQGRIVGVDKARCPDSSICRELDLLEPEQTVRMIGEIRPDYIFHLAGVVYSNDWLELYRGNVETTINILDAVKEAQIPARVVIAGSAAEYGRSSPEDLPLSEKQIPNPVTPYGVAKVWQTAVAKYYAVKGADVVIGRMFNIIGKNAPAGLSVGAFAEQLKKIKRGELPPEILVGNLKPRRDFVDAADACRALISLARQGRSGEVYNICSGRSVFMDEILRMMIRAAGIECAVTADPKRFKAADIADSFGSNKKIRGETGWSPSVSLKESVDALVAGA